MRCFGSRYAVIGSTVGVSDANGIGQPEAGTLEARLTAVPGPALFIPTHQGQGLPASEITALPTRSGSTKNSTYFALTPQSFTDFDWLAVVHQRHTTAAVRRCQSRMPAPGSRGVAYEVARGRLSFVRHATTPKPTRLAEKWLAAGFWNKGNRQRRNKSGLSWHGAAPRVKNARNACVAVSLVLIKIQPSFCEGLLARIAHR